MLINNFLLHRIRCSSISAKMSSSSDCQNIDLKTDCQPTLSNPIQRPCKGINVARREPRNEPRSHNSIESSELEGSIMSGSNGKQLNRIDMLVDL